MSDGLAEDSEGEGYFAAVSDLMVGVLFVFLLMLTVFALNFRDDSAKLEETIARAERAEAAADQARRQADAARLEAEFRVREANRLRALNETLRLRLQEAAEALRRELAGREAARVALLQRLARGLEARNIQFIVDQHSGVLRLSDAVPFATNSSELTPVAQRTVSGLGEVLSQVLPCFAVAAGARCEAGDAPVLEAMLVEGHTDQQVFLNMTRLQSEQRNDQLSTARALTVFAELRRLQPGLEALRNAADQPLLGVSGYGERRPLPDSAGTTAQNWAQNRRIDLRFILSARNSDEIRQLLEQINTLQMQSAP